MEQPACERHMKISILQLLQAQRLQKLVVARFITFMQRGSPQAHAGCKGLWRKKLLPSLWLNGTQHFRSGSTYFSSVISVEIVAFALLKEILGFLP